MKCISFNVNSLRVREHQMRALIKKHDPDIIGLQETKVRDEEFPKDYLESLGYHVSYFGQKTHYGVSILSKKPFLHIVKGFPGDDEDTQKRFIACSIEGPDNKKTHILNGYFPQGESQSHPTKYANKKHFYSALLDYLNTYHSPEEAILLIGDMNIAPTDEDIGIGEDNRKRWLKTGKCSFLPEERQWLKALYDWGLNDTYKALHSTENFSWFDYRSRGFERDPKRGLRIDLILATHSLSQKCNDSGIDYAIRAMEKPSDHCPVWSHFDIV